MIISNPSPRVYFRSEVIWAYVKNERRNVWGASQNRISGTFVNDIPIGLFQFKKEDGDLIEETIFI